MSETLILILGLIIGSFLNVCIYRIPRKESIVVPGSHCPDCGEALLWRHKLPVISYLFLRGRCFWCEQGIPRHYPLVELLTAALGLILYSKYGPTAEFLLLAGLTLILIVVSGIDCQTLRIPNALLGWGLVFWLLPLAWTPASLPPGLLGAAAGSGALLMIAITGALIFRKPGVGVGDIKLAGLIGLFLGMEGALMALGAAIFTGGMVGIVGLIFGRLQRDSKLPFGAFLAFGTWVYLISDL